jgi:hypothetical protein
MVCIGMLIHLCLYKCWTNRHKAGREIKIIREGVHNKVDNGRLPFRTLR